MKARFLALAALVLGLASCQNDFEAGNIVAGGEVDFQLSVATPELATRAGEDGADTQNAKDSAFGAIDYLQGAGWSSVDLRYSLEVYDVTEDTAGNKVVTNTTPVKDRMVKVVDAYEPVVFDLRLVPNRDYRFVVFADFVAQGATDTPTVAAQANIGLRHDIGDTLQEITVKENDDDNKWLNDEVADAYFAFKDIKITNSKAQDMVLRRPYGKLRVIATDLAELNLNVEPNEVKVTYTAANPNEFNAVTGEIQVDNTPVEYVINYDKKAGKASLADYTYTEDYDAKTVKNANNETRHSHITLFTDYILAEAEQNPINFKMEVFDRDGGIIKETMFNTAIPVQRNHLTTVIGNVLTTATEIEVRIDDNFAGNHYFNLWDGLSSTMPEYVDAEKTYLIREASELAWVADQVNGTTRATAHTFAGYTIKLVKDIHLNGERWQPIGATGTFKGTFDGNGHTIEGLFVSAEGEAAAGLFANCIGTIKNLTVVNSQVYGHWHAGIIVGYGICSRIEGCTVDNCVVVSTPYMKDNGNNVGAIAGYLSAESTAYVKGCTVTNTKVTGYRKVGGIVGAANRSGSNIAEISGNTIKACYITADMTAEYKEVKPADAGQVVGWAHAGAIVENNTVGGSAVVDNVNVAVRINKAEDIKPNLGKTLILESGVYEFKEDLEGKGTTFQAAAGAKVTFNGNGHKFNLGTDMNYGLIIKSNGEETEFVINDVNVVSGGGGLAANGGAKLIFNGSSVYVDSDSTSGRYVVYAEGEGTEIVINDGTFDWNRSKNQKRRYIHTEDGAKVTINGGTFGKASSRSGYTDPITGTGETVINAGKFGFNPTAWVADGCAVKQDGDNWVVTPPVVVEDAAGLAGAIANAEEGSTIALSENVNYGAVTAAELKNVTIKGAEGAVMIFKTTEDSKLENVTLKGVNFEYTGATADCGIVINANAQIDNLVVEGCTFVGTGAKAGRGISGLNNNASIVLKGCTFKDLGYPIYAWGGYEALTIEGCTFDNIKSWAIMPQSGFDGDLTVTGNTFQNCLGGGLVKAGTLTAGHTFTFTNNVITNCTIAGDHNWFQFNVSAGTSVISGNTKDGAAWTPTAAEGLK